MCFEDLGLIDTFTCLYDQKPVWLLPIVLLSTDHAPPLVAPFSQKNTRCSRPRGSCCNSGTSRTLAGALMRRKWSVLLIIITCTILNFSASCAACSNASFYSIKGPFRGLYFNPENAFVFSQSPLFKAVKPFFIIFRAVSVVTTFHLLHVFFGWRFQLPLALYSCLLFFFSLFSKLETCLLHLFLGEDVPTFHVRIVLFPSFSKAFHGAPNGP